MILRETGISSLKTLFLLRISISFRFSFPKNLIIIKKIVEKVTLQLKSILLILPKMTKINSRT